MDFTDLFAYDTGIHGNWLGGRGGGSVCSTGSTAHSSTLKRVDESLRAGLTPERDLTITNHQGGRVRAQIDVEGKSLGNSRGEGDQAGVLDKHRGW